MTQSRKKNPTRRMGRPTAKQSQELNEKIKSVALNLFLEDGFDSVTMEIVAREANITKRTLYMRYNDKGELFADAIRKAKDGWDFPDVELVANQNEPLASQLQALAEALLKHALNPKVIKLARIATAQADNFPEEIRGKYNIASSPRIVSVVKVLKLHESKVDPTYFNNIEMTAELFIGLISGIPARYAGMGMIRDPGLEKRRIELAVDLFVEGIGKKQ